MTKLKVAILEDNKEILKEFVNDLKETNLVEIAVKETSSDSFIEKVRSSEVDFLILDIDLVGDSMTGIDVAHLLKLPVLFASGKTRDYIERIESINIDHDFPVEFITKPAVGERLKKMISKMIEQINSQKSNQSIYFDIKDLKKDDRNVKLTSIAFIETISDGSNNKTVYFTNKKPEVIYNLSFPKLEEKGIKLPLFLKPSQSYRVNKNSIQKYDKENFKLIVECMNSSGNLEKKEIDVSENYRSEIRKELK
jgi:DNA-binding LytR/AlgR family response regulator